MPEQYKAHHSQYDGEPIKKDYAKLARKITDTVTHKITLHNKSSYPVVQRLSNYGNVAIAPGKKRAFDDEALTLYEYSPSKTVIRIKEDSHTFVYKNR